MTFKVSSSLINLKVWLGHTISRSFDVWPMRSFPADFKFRMGILKIIMDMYMYPSTAIGTVTVQSDQVQWPKKAIFNRRSLFSDDILGRFL
jgi:hypothetical protein